MKRIILSAVLVFAASSASASLIGDTVTMDWEFNGTPCALCSTVNTIVAAGPADAVSPNPTAISVNVEAESILIDLVTNGVVIGDPLSDFVGLIVSSLNWTDYPDGSIIDVLLDTSFFAFDASRISFTGDSVSVNLAGLTVTETDFVNLDLVTSHAVSEPGMLALLVIGLAGIAFARRRR